MTEIENVYQSFGSVHDPCIALTCAYQLDGSFYCCQEPECELDIDYTEQSDFPMLPCY